MIMVPRLTAIISDESLYESTGFFFYIPPKVQTPAICLYSPDTIPPQRCEEIGSARTSFPGPDKRQRIREN